MALGGAPPDAGGPRRNRTRDGAGAREFECGRERRGEGGRARDAEGGEPLAFSTVILPTIEVDVVEYRDGLLLLRRAIEPHIGSWHFPHGHVEYGERPADGAARETLEETGLALGEADGFELHRLDYWLRAITPSSSPIRFHARFFAAESRSRRVFEYQVRTSAGEMADRARSWSGRSSSSRRA